MQNLNEKSIVSYMNDALVRKNIENTLGAKAPQFIASVASLVNSNQSLAECDKQSILRACLMASSLDLPINQNLGFAYIVAYNTKVKSLDERGNEITTFVKKAQFQIGYKGFIQLAQRSGLFKTINASDVRLGELKGRNPLTGEIDFEWIIDPKTRENTQVIGYVGYFRLHNGFEKSLYMSVEELKKHGLKYSKSYKDGLWATDFGIMAGKTVIKLLLSRYAPMTTEMQTAQLADQAIIEENGYRYIDNEVETPDDIAKQKEIARVIKHIENAKTIQELDLCADVLINDELREKYDEKYKVLKGKEKYELG